MSSQDAASKMPKEQSSGERQQRLSENQTQ